jgi:hypothetical protein
MSLRSALVPAMRGRAEVCLRRNLAVGLGIGEELLTTLNPPIDHNGSFTLVPLLEILGP